jgi:hypothetical protein
MFADDHPFDGEAVPGVALFGQKVDIWFIPVEDEIQRRARESLGAVTNAEQLQALRAIPPDVAVPTVSIGAVELLIFNELDAAVVELREHDVVRHLVAPVQLRGIVKQARDWEDVQAISLLRTHAPRIVVAPPRLAGRVLRDADPEIGVTIVDDGDLAAVRPAGNRRVRPSWQRWLTAETAFAAWRARR